MVLGEQVSKIVSIFAEIHATRRQNFMRKNWSVFNNNRFQYDHSLEYHSHPLIVIGSMIKKCPNCSARKSKDKTAGMFCSSCKVLRPLLGEPDKPLRTLYLCVANESNKFLSKIRKYDFCSQIMSVVWRIRVEFSPAFTVTRAYISSNWIRFPKL